MHARISRILHANTTHPLLRTLSHHLRRTATCRATVMREPAARHEHTNNHAHAHPLPPPTISHLTTHTPPLTLPALCAAIHARLHAFLTSTDPTNPRLPAVQTQSRISLDIILAALRRYPDPRSLSLSYNGGKDCLVLLILYLSALHTHHTLTPDSPPFPPTLQSVYITSRHPFPAVDAFVAHSESLYHLSLSRYSAPMRDAFAAYLADEPSIEAIFVGTRRTDPHGANLTPFQATDGGWPAFMRVHPVIDWHYAEVWTFIRELGVDYCGLYDEGYTSLGGTKDTRPNPALKQEDGREGFRPAYELVEDEEERLGRDFGGAGKEEDA